MKTVLAIIAGMSGIGGVALAQTTAVHTPAKVQSAPAAQQPDDIVVEGYRSRTDLETVVAPAPYFSGVRSRTEYEFSDRLAKCAARSKLSDLSRLRAVVDGAFNTSAHDLAQDRLKRIYITCSESPTLLSFTTAPAGDAQVADALSNSDASPPKVPTGTDSAPLGHSIYDRGAFMIEAIARYAPGLTLTRAQTNDPEVQARFNRREMPRNRFRLPADYRYFEIAVCMVRLEPRLAIRLTRKESNTLDLQAALIDRARACVGGARDVRVDATQFRIYIADAVYRWTVAAQNVESLIPNDKG